MQYMIPSELDIHNSLYQEFLCLILFWCLCIPTGEKEVYTGKTTLLESVKCLFTGGVQLVLPWEPPSYRLDVAMKEWFSLVVSSRNSDCITSVLFGLQFPAPTGQDNWCQWWSWESSAPGGPHSSGNGGYKSVERRLLWPLALICLKITKDNFCHQSSP